ncbi:calcium/sodium antiporter [Patescibacteria group bacterium]|jgi:cation:H+ antiporter|nr:calcium/sodium antiporter [Patescibacteria group bacterium]
MSIALAILMLVGGLAALIKGADWLVDGASSLARRLGISPIVIGLTIVAFGTSAPELIVNLVAAFRGNTDIAIGNIVGSNLANILLILGIAGLITPLVVKKNTVWKEIPLALLACVLVLIMASDALLTGRPANTLDRIDGIVLIAFFIIFLYYTFGISKAEAEGENVETHPLAPTIGWIVAGLALLVVGGKFAVDGATDIATSLGISERLIGLTVVAIGTSLPELLTSAVAASKGKADIAIGNVVGSNIFNVFWILGVSSILRPLPFSSGNLFDVFMAIGASFLLFLAMFVGRKHLLERWQSGAFIALYVAYVGFLVFTT